MTTDWKSLGFEYLDTNGYAIARYRDGSWSAPEFLASRSLEMHVAANCLHYGQACFEGLKVFSHADGNAFLFRPQLNAQRMAGSAERVCMVAPPQELFIETCKLAIENNREFVPPYGTGASLYVRPLLIGTQATIGLSPSEEYVFIVMVTPVGAYYKDGFSPVKALVVDDYDRAAPQGTGQAKVAGNYAAGMKPGLIAKQKGFPIALFTDAKEHKYIDEFGTSNFIGITSAREYVTPDSPAILQSITNLTLQAIAESEGYTVQSRPIALEELADFSEVGACGTAAIITPICSIQRDDQEWTFGSANQAGPVLSMLLEKLQAIQYGEIADPDDWLMPLAE